jgi:hypothetical protein
MEFKTSIDRVPWSRNSPGNTLLGLTLLDSGNVETLLTSGQPNDVESPTIKTFNQRLKPSGNTALGIGSEPQALAAVSFDANGNLYVAHSTNVVSRYAPDGTSLGADILVAGEVMSVAAAPSGTFAVVWETGYDELYAQYYATDGAPNGSPILVQPTSNGEVSTNHINAASSALDDSGKLVVVWIDTNYNGSTYPPITIAGRTVSGP